MARKSTRRARPIEVSEDAPVGEQLAAFFERNGYVRTQSEDRLEEEGWSRYKKGHEVRLTASTKAELARIRRLLRDAGFEPGKPYVQVTQWRIPLYGREPVLKFLALVRKRPGKR